MESDLEYKYNINQSVQYKYQYDQNYDYDNGLDNQVNQIFKIDKQVL